MADDPNPTLRAELLAALAVVAPQIHGLRSLEAIPMSDELRGQIDTQIIHRERRRDLIQAVLDLLDSVLEAQNALEADGYPALGTVPLSAELIAELTRDVADVEAGARVFTAGLAADLAANLTVNFGEPVAKPTA